MGLGGTVITGRAYNGLEDHCAVQVLPAPQSLALASASVSLSVGQQAFLQVAPVPEGSACSLTYKSSKPKCVAVSEDGVLTGLKKGKSVITVATQNGVTAKVKVQVMAAPKTVSLSLDRASLPVEQAIIPHAGVAKLIAELAIGEAEQRAAAAMNYRVVSRGEKFWLGGAEFLVLGPVVVRNANPKKGEENDNSLVLRVTFGNNTFLLTGDAGNAELKDLEAADPGCLRAQVFKNPHHSAKKRFAVEMCQPQIAVFSTDRRNRPNSGIVRLLQKMGAAIYNTADNKNGDVTIVSDGATLTVTTQK